MKMLGFDIVDCVQIGTICTTPDSVDTALEYLEMRYQHFLKSGKPVFVMDSVHGVCPLIDSQQPANAGELVKSNRITSWLLEKNSCESHRVCVTTRHYSMINPRLL